MTDPCEHADVKLGLLVTGVRAHVCMDCGLFEPLVRAREILREEMFRKYLEKFDVGEESGDH